MFGDEQASAEGDKFAFCVTSGSGLSGFRDKENGNAREQTGGVLSYLREKSEYPRPDPTRPGPTRPHHAL